MRTASRPARCGNFCPAIASMNHDVMMTRLFKLPRPYFRRPRSASPFSLS